MATDALILDAIAASLLAVDGLNAEAVYSAGTTAGVTAGVKELPDDIGVALPATVIGVGDDVRGGGSGQERQTWTVEGSVWVSSAPRGERYRQLVLLKEPIAAAIAQYSKGNLAVHGDTAVQSVGPGVTFGGIAWRQWSRTADATWFLVLPFELEVKVNRPRTYGAL